MAHEFREPVFVRNDDTTDIKASVVVWDPIENLCDRSIRLKSGDNSVLINIDDWPAIKRAIDNEISNTNFE